MKKLIILIISIILLANLISAQEVIVTKETTENIKINDIIEVKINILNPYSTEKTYEVSERIPNNIELIEPSQPDEVKQFNGIEANFLKWNLLISPNMISTISYKIKIKELGDYSIQATDITDSLTEEVYFSNSLEFSVDCNPNNQCEENENYLNCPEDCDKGAADGICNYAADGICDPDCEEEPDCEETKLNILVIILIPLILAIIIFILFLLFKRKKPPEIKQEIPQETQQNIQY